MISCNKFNKLLETKANKEIHSKNKGVVQVQKGEEEIN